jgi:hypothetical protein
MDDNKEQSYNKENADDVQPCCPSASDGGDCCTPGTGKSWKTIVFVVVILLAGAVAAHSLVTKNDEKASISPQAASSCDTSESPIEAWGVAEQSSKNTVVSCGVTLDSMKSLGKMAADKKANVAFIFLAGDKEDSARTASAQVEATMNMLSNKGQQVAAFTLQNDAEGYDQLIQQFKVKSLPCVIVAGKGCGAAAVSGDITEPKLLEAFVIASRPVSGCGPSGCAPSGCSPSGSK